MIETVSLKCHDPLSAPREQAHIARQVKVLEKQGFSIVRTRGEMYESIVASRHITIDENGAVQSV